jgi:hypothetical protein
MQGLLTNETTKWWSVGGTVTWSILSVPLHHEGQVSGCAMSEYYPEQDYEDPFVFAYHLCEIRKDNSIHQFDNA